jgi:KDO2-lipid IV(A) lauroyltransferase
MPEITSNQMKNQPERGSLTHKFQYYLFLSISFWVSLLPRGVMVKVGRGFGALGYLIWKERRRIALSNLDLAFGGTKKDEEKRWIAKEAFKNIGATMMELGWGMRRMNEKAFFKIVEVEGLEILRSVLSQRKGAIMLPAHYGNWEIMANAVGYLKFNAHYVAKRLKNPYLDRMVNEYRCETGNKVIYMNGASKEMEEVLKRGGVVATLLDQKVPLHEGGILVKFFGHNAPTTPLIAKLHLLTFAPLLLVRCYPLKGGKCRLVFGPEIRFEPSGDYEKDLHILTQKCLEAIESYIREKPQFWTWGHKRWKLD